MAQLLLSVQKHNLYKFLYVFQVEIKKEETKNEIATTIQRTQNYIKRNKFIKFIIMIMALLAYHLISHISS